MIGILTFYWADDYGAMLQSYALKTYLNKYGKAVLIPYFPRNLRGRYGLICYNRADNLPRRLYKMARRQLKPKAFYYNLKRKRGMNGFRRAYLTDEKRHLASSNEIYRYSREIDTYVVGSDQVWNPEITEGFQEGYFCTFRRYRGDHVRCVSYAASIGMEKLEKKYDEELSGLLANFDMISIREPLSEPYLAKRWGKKPEVVLDPVFLLEKKEWEEILEKLPKKALNAMIYGRDGGRRFSYEKAVSSKRGYIAVYDTEYLPEMAEYLNKLEKDSGLFVVVIHAMEKTYRWTESEKLLIGQSPLEFLAILYHASYVVTNSFHGTALSIILKKQFVTFPHSTRGARMRDLLRIAHLEDRLVTGKEKAVRIEEKIDWDEAGQALEKEIIHSKAFIQNEILVPPDDKKGDNRSENREDTKTLKKGGRNHVRNRGIT